LEYLLSTKNRDVYTYTVTSRDVNFRYPDQFVNGAKKFLAFFVPEFSAEFSAPTGIFRQCNGKYLSTG
jgi:hypothetical protein